MNEKIREKIFAKKNLGQHFLVNKHLAKQIASDFASEGEAILEVGPGTGILTETLLTWKMPLHIIEKDKRMLSPLSKIVAPAQISITDALDIDLRALITKLKWEKKKIWFISNLPYNVSVPIFIKFLQIPNINYMTLMFQKEVGEKILPLEHLRNTTNSLMAIASNFFKITLLSKVSAGSFSPPPEVESEVLSFSRWGHPVIPLKEFDSYEQFLRRLFQMKRKQMGTVLRKYYSLELLRDVFTEVGLNSMDRAESIDLHTLQDLYHHLKGKEKVSKKN